MTNKKKITLKLILILIGNTGLVIFWITPLLVRFFPDYQVWYSAWPEKSPQCPLVSDCDSPGLFLYQMGPAMVISSILLTAYFLFLPLYELRAFKLWNINYKLSSLLTLIIPTIFLVGPVEELIHAPVLSSVMISLFALALIGSSLLFQRSMNLSKT